MSRLPSLTPFIFFSAAIAIWIDFGSLHDFDNVELQTYKLEPVKLSRRLPTIAVLEATK